MTAHRSPNKLMSDWLNKDPNYVREFTVSEITEIAWRLGKIPTKERGSCGTQDSTNKTSGSDTRSESDVSKTKRRRNFSARSIE